jgi:hypothetical protein
MRRVVKLGLEPGASWVYLVRGLLRWRASEGAFREVWQGEREAQRSLYDVNSASKMTFTLSAIFACYAKNVVFSN